MKLVATMPVRNEEWCLEASLRAVLVWCDAVVVGLHACTDRSVQIAAAIGAEFPGRLVCMTHHGDAWDEMEHRQRLLQRARAEGATHVAIVDADEILTANLAGRIRRLVEILPDDRVLQIPLYNLRGGLNRFHVNGIWGNRWVSVAFVDSPALCWTGDTFHHREPFGIRLLDWRPVSQHDGGVMHLWGASERRLLAKHALYKLTERLRWPLKPLEEIDRLYSLAIHPREPWNFAPVPAEWWDAQLLTTVNLADEPWQIEECRRIIATHPAISEGLDLFGILEPKQT